MTLLTRSAFIVFLFLVLGFTTTNSISQETGSQDIDSESIADLQKMFDFISQTETISVTTESNYDARQKSGQFIEFGAISKWYIKRPSHVRVDIENRDGTERSFYFDGNSLTLYDKNQNVYATVIKKGNLDQAFDYYMDELDMPMPLAELFSEKHPFDINKSVISSMYVGESKINGFACDDLAFRTEEVDLQVWIEQGKKPLPQRMIITYKESPESPQYRARFSDWNLSPKLKDSLFEFKPPKDAEKIQFSPRINKGQMTDGKNKGGQ